MFLLAFGALLVIVEARSSWVQSHVFTALDRHLKFALKQGASSHVANTGTGPYDERLGFADLQKIIGRLESNGYTVTAQARISRVAQALARIGLPAIYHEKTQAGLAIEDWQGNPLFVSRFPGRAYADFREIPATVVKTLLFIENRQLRDLSHPERNPAIEWDRLGKAVIDVSVHTIDRGHRKAGGSTLATQLEKMRHSPNGATQSVGEKIRQVAAASLRAYQDGPDTRQAQQRIICDYINSFPASATQADGEVFGLGDGLHAWYGTDFRKANQLLDAEERGLNARHTAERARIYRQALSLFLALRAPSYYLLDHTDQLTALTDRYLRLLGATGTISPALRDAALRIKETPAPQMHGAQSGRYISNKAPNAIRSALLPMLGLDNPYALDRLDLTVKTTLDHPAQESATRFLQSLATPAGSAAAGLQGFQLLDRGNPQSVIYSVTLYERMNGANVLRVQTDNYDQPLDISQGTRLQLGSTAKLRTLINYLEIVQELHERYGRLSAAELRSVHTVPRDAISAWALAYLSSTRNRELEPMFEAALQRKYSGNPGEAFYTGGGLQSFANFESSEDSGIMSVSEGFQKSVNLVFIRLLRDIERYYMYRVPGLSPEILKDPENPARQEYLKKFAAMESAVYMKRFYERFRGLSSDDALERLAGGIPLTAVRAAVIYRSVRPQDSFDQFAAFLRAHVPARELARRTPEDLYAKYAIDKFNLQDRGYLARVHPLELWMLNYREQHPDAKFAEMYAKSGDERQQVYQWLFKTPHQGAQNERIQTLMEIRAFQEIHQAWKRLGYPFDALVPSYATAIGVSGDTPAALAKLVGIIVNDGMLYPNERIQLLDFGAGTPAETVLAPKLAPGRRVLSPAIAKLVRRDMVGVVQNGTGWRIRSGVSLPDGTVLPVGGKTGTGDNEFRVYGKGGGLLGSRVVNRTAAFAFFLGDRFFGTIIAFVPGKGAANYGFTSGLAVQVLKDLTPSFLPLIQKAEPQHFRGAGVIEKAQVAGQPQAIDR